MIEIEFTEEAIDELRYQRFNHPHPRVQRKMEALVEERRLAAPSDYSNPGCFGKYAPSILAG